MALLLAACNSEALRLLGTQTCARLGLEARVVVSGAEMLELAQQLRPRVVILEDSMPDLSGVEVCRRLKRDPALGACHVMMVVRGILGGALREQLDEAGCDDVLVLPTLGEEFVAHLADLVGVPRRRERRVRVEIRAQLLSGARVWRGLVGNLSAHGARVRLDEPFGGSEPLRVRLESSTGEPSVAASARVAWRDDDGRLLGLEFVETGEAARRQLAVLALWEIVEEEGLQRVFMEGDITETTELEPLVARLSGPVDFDAAGVRYVNSQGTRQWIGFLQSLPAAVEYTFSRCSVTFVTQASMLVDFLGRGRVFSLLVPYHCEGCDGDEQRLVQAAALGAAGEPPRPPRLHCPRCRSLMSFDEVSERYFAFLGH